MATLCCLAARCLFGVVFLHKAKQSRWLCAVSACKSPPHQRTAHRFTRHDSAKSLTPGHGHCVVFCGKFFWKCLVLGNLTCAQEHRCLHVAWWTRSFYIRSSIGQFNTAHAQTIDYLRVGRAMFCHAILITRIPTGPRSRSPRNT